MASELDQSYDFRIVEPRWQRVWETSDRYGATAPSDRPKYYVCDYLPTPNGPLHMGHTRVYLLGDSAARYRKQRGYEVLHPMAFDSFGLPIEIEANKTGIHPFVLANHYAQVMQGQFKRMGYATSFRSTFSMCDPRVYRWTQFIFNQLLKHDLAYRKEGLVNYCPSCNTSLAYEQVESGACWRCETPVETRVIPQWYYRITRFAEDLIRDLNRVPGWPENMKRMQVNWIGRSEGVYVDFPIKDQSGVIRVFTTRPEGLFGTTFLAVSPLHPLAKTLTPASDLPRLEAMLLAQNRFDEEKVKTGWRLDIHAVHPFTGEVLPVYVVNYVESGYAQGAVAGVPGHDARDAEFAEIMGLPVKWVTTGASMNCRTRHQVLDSSGRVVNSGPFSDLSIDEARKRIVDAIEKKNLGLAAVEYRLHDWCISRQRYWGTPIPIIYCRNCGIVPVPDEDLPVFLPLNVKPTFVGNPLNECHDFVSCNCMVCGAPAVRETDTMDTYCDSSWYVFRCCSPDLALSPFDPHSVTRWMPIDLGVGGVDAINFLLYTRFMCKAFQQMGLIAFPEPVSRLLVQYPILYQGRKMGKRSKNAISPDEILEEYGADTLRVFVLFLGAPNKVMEWKENHLPGCNRFLSTFWSMAARNIRRGLSHRPDKNLVLRHPETATRISDTIRLVTKAYEKGHFNVVLQRIRRLVKDLEEIERTEATDETELSRRRDLLGKSMLTLTQLLAPIAPHMTQEIWHRAGQEGLIEDGPWPNPDHWLSRRSTRTVVVQVDGTLQFETFLPRRATEEEECELMRKLIIDRGILPSDWRGKHLLFRGRKFDVFNVVTNCELLKDNLDRPAARDDD